MDKFHEQLLRTKKSITYKLFNIGMYLCIVFAFIAVTFVSMNITMVVIAALFIAGFFAMRILRDKQYREFEYILTNGNFQIDVIYNMKKRKTLYDLEIKNFEEFGKSSEIKYSNQYKKVDCVPWDNQDERYVILIGEKERQAIFIAPNEAMLKLISLYKVRRARI